MSRLWRLPLERGWAFWLLALLVLGIGIGLRGPWPADEPRFALIARDMVLTWDWFFPRVAGELYADKPPLFFWAIAAAYLFIGDLDIAFLLPSLLAGLGTLWLVSDLGRRLWDPRTGRVAALVLLFTIQFTVQSRTAQIDAALMFFTTLGLYGLCRHLLTGPDWRWYLMAWVAMGLGIITKGVGFLPVFLFLPWAWALWRGWPGLAVRGGDWRWWLGPVALLATVSLWALPMLWFTSSSGDPALIAYRDEILLDQTLARYADAWHHIEPVWYYLVEVIPWLWLPLTAALPWLVPAWVRAIRDRDPRCLMFLGLVLAVVVFFSLSPGKRGVYLLPVLPALVLAAAPVLREIVDRRGPRLMALGLTLSAGAVAASVWAWFRILRAEEGAALVERYGVEPWAPLAAVALAAALSVAMTRLRHAAAGLCLFMTAFWLIMGSWVYPLADPVRSGRALMVEAERELGQRYQLGLIHWGEQQALQANVPLVHFGARRLDWAEERLDGVAWLMTTPRARLLVEEQLLQSCFEVDRERSLGYFHRQDWYIVGPDAVVGQCAKRWEERRWESRVNRHYYGISGLRLR